MNLRKTAPRLKSQSRPYPIKRESARKEIVRDELISRAAAVFQERGYVQTNIADVANVLGMSRSSLYHYFESKDELIETIVANEIAVRAGFGAPIVAASEQPATPRLRRLLEHRIEREFTRGISLRMFDQLERGVAESVIASVRNAHQQALTLYVEIMRQGVASSEFRAENPAILALAVISMTNWNPWWLSGASTLPVEQIAATLSALAIGAVRAPDRTIVAPDVGPAVALATELLTTLCNL